MDPEIKEMMEKTKINRQRFEAHIKALKDFEEDFDEKENSKPVIRDKTKTRLQRLGVLYGDGEISSPIHRSEGWFAEEEDPDWDGERRANNRLSEERTKRLAALASTINSWEDDLRHISPKKQEVERYDRFGNLVGSRAVRHETVSTGGVLGKKPLATKNEQIPENIPVTPKKVAWDRNIISSLERQGFKRCESEEHLVYDYKSPEKAECRNQSPKRNVARNVAPAPPPPPVQKMESPVRKRSPQKSAVLEMAAQYETSPIKATKAKDPAELSVAEKKAVFERNNGAIPMPTAKPFMKPALVSRDLSPKRQKTFIINGKEPEQQPKPEAVETPTRSPVRDCIKQAIIERRMEIEALKHRWDKNRAIASKIGSPGGIPEAPPLPSPAAVNSPKRIKMGLHSPANSPPKPAPVATSQPEARETASPRQRHQQLPRILSVREKSPSRMEAPSYPEIKKIRVSPPKPGHLYPSVSDIEVDSEVTESELDPIEEEDENSYTTDPESSLSSASSFGKQIVRQASKNNLKRPTSSPIGSSTTDSNSSSANESRILKEMDDLLDEALGEPSLKRSKSSEDSLRSGAKSSLSISGSCSSTSFDFSEPAPASSREPSKPPTYCVQPATSSSDDSDTPAYSQYRSPSRTTESTNLVHTLSVFRKQQSSALQPSTPIRREVRKNDICLEELVKKEEEMYYGGDEDKLVEKRIKELQIEVQKQITIISQASQALNLCTSTIEFSGSQEEVEAQKLLLVATTRRNAMNQEIDRLKVEKKLKPGLIGVTDKGDITVNKISLPIKTFQVSDSVIHLVCLVKSGATVLHSECLAVSKKTVTNGKMTFNKAMTLKGLYSDFMATVEVYQFTTRIKDYLPHELKYRITPSKKEKSKGGKKKDKLAFSVVESPAGPNAVRSPGFHLCGYIVFSLREITRTHFTLNKVPYTSPLEGTLEMSITSSMESQVEYAGFLTIFEDVSGFGAWKRRWAALKGTGIAFWTYPEQHKEGKVAIDWIDLTEVITEEAGLAPRDICARPHTILLESRIPGSALPESLVRRRDGNDMIITHLLSADTKEDRLVWCKQLNKVLLLLRAWKVAPSTHK